MSTADQLVERGADRLETLAARAGTADGLARKLAQPLADDAQFLRKLKPSLMRARLRGQAPKDEQPTPADVPHDGGEPARKGGGGGPSPLLVAAVAFAVGIAAAKWIDWKGHGHPRR